MNPTIYALCQKPILGLVLLLTNACSFPPLISDLSLSLVSSGTVATKEFEVRVDKSYFFELAFEFSSFAAVRQDYVTGDGSNYDKHCDGEGKVEDITPFLQAGAGRPIPIQIVITSATAKGTIVDRTFMTMCRFGWGGQTRPIIWRHIGRVSLAPGKYRVTIKNLEAQPGLDGVKTTVSLVAGHGMRS